MSNTFKQSHVITDRDARDRWVNSGGHGDRCQVCWRPLAIPVWLGSAPHHIVHGANGRSDEPCNLILLCSRCHGMTHSDQFRDERTGQLLPDITFGMVLFVKSQTSEWNPERLAELYHRRLPDLEELPEYYLADRVRWGGLAGQHEGNLTC